VGNVVRAFCSWRPGSGDSVATPPASIAEEARRQSWRRCGLYHSILLASLLLLAITGSLNLSALVAFAPVLIRSFWQLAKPVRQINLRRVGWLEIVYSVVFLIFTTLTFRV
jgi:hypothetical protein